MERLLTDRVKESMKVFALLVLTMLLSSGCGVYSFRPSGKSAISSLAVQRFQNESAELGLTDRITDLVIDAFIADGSIKIVTHENAEALLEGVLVGYSRKPRSFDENDQVQEYAVTMRFEIKLKNPSDDTEIWQETISEIGIYAVISETEETGQNKAIELLVQAIINRTTKSW